jgi:2-polyprenyl-3-methyl-5-hydroxy-6-metoxy-1,4-benzoquinol methylase
MYGAILAQGEDEGNECSLLEDGMQPHVEARLLELNRQFYGRFALPFASSRSAGQVSLRRVAQGIAVGAAVLDVGCGDGRAARALDDAGTAATYLGVDGSHEMIALARQRSATLRSVQARFVVAEVSQPGWASGLAAAAFDAVLCLAVLHHIAGQERRARLVRDMACLLKPGGRLIVSTWQFLGSERLRRKVVPWSAAGLAGSDVDAGDFLLDWKRGGEGLRYCRLIGQEELLELGAAAGLTASDSYAADAGLNLFVTFCRPPRLSTAP